MKKIIACLLIAFIAALKLSAQDSIGVYPTNWWVGMTNPKLQLMFHGRNAGNNMQMLQNHQISPINMKVSEILTPTPCIIEKTNFSPQK